MKILVITNELMYPPQTGSKTREYNLFSRLAERHEVKMISFIYAPDEKEVAKELQSKIPVETVDFELPRSYRLMQESRWPWSRLRYLWLLFFDPLPFLVSYFRSDAMRRKVEETLSRERFDIVAVIPSMMVQHLPPKVAAKTSVTLSNVEALVQRRNYEKAKGFVRRLENYIEWRKMHRMERDAFRRLDLCVAVSELERKAALEIEPRANVAVVDNGVDTSYFEPVPSEISPNSLVFTGTMKYAPNEEAMLYFCREILPLIREQVPDVRLSIVGHSPHPSVRNLASLSGVEVIGAVPDIRPYLSRAAVVIVPLLSGGGTRLKILEALSMGKAVVSTSMGAEGLEVEHSRHILIADDPATFADQVVSMLNTPESAAALGAAGRELARSRYDWEILARRLEEAYVSAVSNER
ncbi:MAG: glycosyltransferase [Armatimonadetes bacterium]|nr:glycosyltransferase [Armatimonadota bacterium]